MGGKDLGVVRKRQELLVNAPVHDGGKNQARGQSLHRGAVASGGGTRERGRCEVAESGREDPDANA